MTSECARSLIVTTSDGVVQRLRMDHVRAFARTERGIVEIRSQREQERLARRGPLPLLVAARGDSDATIDRLTPSSWSVPPPGFEKRSGDPLPTAGPTMITRGRRAREILTESERAAGLPDAGFEPPRLNAATRRLLGAAATEVVTRALSDPAGDTRKVAVVDLLRDVGGQKVAVWPTDAGSIVRVGAVNPYELATGVPAMALLGTDNEVLDIVPAKFDMPFSAEEDPLVQVQTGWFSRKRQQVREKLDRLPSTLMNLTVAGGSGMAAKQATVAIAAAGALAPASPTLAAVAAAATLAARPGIRLLVQTLGQTADPRQVDYQSSVDRERVALVVPLRPVRSYGSGGADTAMRHAEVYSELDTQRLRLLKQARERHPNDAAAVERIDSAVTEHVTRLTLDIKLNSRRRPKHLLAPALQQLLVYGGPEHALQKVADAA